MHIVFLIILVVYLITLYMIGRRVMSTWFAGFPDLLNAAGAFLVGSGIGVPVTYYLSCLFAKTKEPILWGVIFTFVLFLIILFVWNKSKQQVRKMYYSCSDIAIATLATIFSSWIMLKTFHGDASGQLFVGSNNVFDFGHALGIIRSFSWGSNIPMMSPFESGSPFFYHFFFYFFVALWEYFGVPIVWALNIPSILSFATFLIVIYYLPQIVAKQKPLVGWIAVALTITNSSLTFLYIKSFSRVWHLQTYPFAGPFDGSTISLFVTLNSYINQRHLAFSVAFGLLLYLLVVRGLETKKTDITRMVTLGLISGLLFYWNMAIFAIVVVVVILTLLLHKMYKAVVWYILALAFIEIMFILPLIPVLVNAAGLIKNNIVLTAATDSSNWNITSYFWQNLGLLPLIAVIGYILLSKKAKSLMLPFSVLFVLECIFAVVGHKGFDQKFLSFLIIPVNMFAAVGVVWIWERKRLVWKTGAALLFCVLILSGLIDLMPIKNEFAFPIISRKILPVISWIHTNTPKNAVFVSYPDIIDPVVLAGRKNYFGFFGNIGWQNRSTDVSKIYNGDGNTLKNTNEYYIIVPKWEKSDFPYAVNMKALNDKYKIAYEDKRFLILGTSHD